MNTIPIKIYYKMTLVTKGIIENMIHAACVELYGVSSIALRDTDAPHYVDF